MDRDRLREIEKMRMESGQSVRSYEDHMSGMDPGIFFLFRCFLLFFWNSNCLWLFWFTLFHYIFSEAISMIFLIIGAFEKAFISAESPSFGEIFFRQSNIKNRRSRKRGMYSKSEITKEPVTIVLLNFVKPTKGMSSNHPRKPLNCGTVRIL